MLRRQAGQNEEELGAENRVNEWLPRQESSRRRPGDQLWPRQVLRWRAICALAARGSRRSARPRPAPTTTCARPSSRPTCFNQKLVELARARDEQVRAINSSAGMGRPPARHPRA